MGSARAGGWTTLSMGRSTAGRGHARYPNGRGPTVNPTVVPAASSVEIGTQRRRTLSENVVKVLLYRHPGRNL